MAYRRGVQRRRRRDCYSYRHFSHNSEYYDGGDQNNYSYEKVPPQTHGENQFYGDHVTLKGAGAEAEADVPNDASYNEQYHQENLLESKWQPPEPESEPSSFQNIVNSTNDIHWNCSATSLFTMEYDFDVNFLQWEEKYLQWKRENLAHPNRPLYRQYECEMEKRRQSIIEMRQRIIDQSTVDLRSPESDIEFLTSLMYALRKAVEQGTKIKLNKFHLNCFSNQCASAFP